MDSEAMTSKGPSTLQLEGGPSTLQPGVPQPANLLKFAEILYRCTLCRTVPSLSDSMDKFFTHMYGAHLNKLKGSVLHSCTRCELKFGTEEDLKHHLKECYMHPSTNETAGPRASKQDSAKTRDVEPHHIKDEPKDPKCEDENGNQFPTSATLTKQLPDSQDTDVKLPTPMPKSRRKRSVPVAYRAQEQYPSDGEDSDAQDTVLDLSMQKKTSSIIQDLEPENLSTKNSMLPPSISSKSVIDSLLPMRTDKSGSTRVHGESASRSLNRFLDGFTPRIMDHQLNPQKARPAGAQSKDLDDSACDSPDGSSYKCRDCEVTFSTFGEHSAHWHSVHGQLGVAEASTVSEAERFNLILPHLPDLLVAHSGGCIGRSDLLERLMPTIQHPSLYQWGAACNRAMRDVFPDSQAARKGKYKKTYYFGVHFIGEPIDTVSMPASVGTPVPSTITSAAVDEEEAGSPSQQLAVRDTSRDVEKLLVILPGIIQWTGQMDSCVIRDHLLQSVSEILDDPEVLNWGMQCNRAVRQGYPAVLMKRRGKYKTCYFGINIVNKTRPDSRQFSPKTQMTHSLTFPPPNHGPPVVNAMDFSDETDRCAKYSKFKRSSEAEGHAEDDDEVKDAKRPKVKKERPDFEVNGLESKSPDGSTSPVSFSSVFELEKLILLHPGPFVTARIVSRRFHRLVPSLDRAIHAMGTLQSHGLGQVFTLKHGNSKVFFKAVPSRSLEVALSLMGVRLSDYQVIFGERDLKLEDTLHDRIKSFYPNLEQLSEFYRY